MPIASSAREKSLTITSSERSGTWKMEVRGNNKTELAAIDQQLAALSRPAPPRPAKTVQEALAGSSVPPSVWRDSNECGGIQGSAYFAKACAQVVQLRRELAAARDYERLSAQAAELRKALAEAPIVATADPLPEAFRSTFGRWLQIGDTEGVALLITIAIETISCFGLAGLEALRREHSGSSALGSPSPSLGSLKLSGTRPSLPEPKISTLPRPSLSAVAPAQGSVQAHTTGEGSKAPSDVLPVPLTPPCEGLPKASPTWDQGGMGGDLAADTSHVAVFARERLRVATGASLWSKELRDAYEAWCAMHGCLPLSLPKFAYELKALGYAKWKSCGRMKYRDLELVEPNARTVVHM
jgi:hypothetical protein